MGDDGAEVDEHVEPVVDEMADLELAAVDRLVGPAPAEPHMVAGQPGGGEEVPVLEPQPRLVLHAGAGFRDQPRPAGKCVDQCADPVHGAGGGGRRHGAVDAAG
jgi:hypothetical protein